MYINDTHILYYTVFGAIGFIVGCLASWFNTKLPEYKKILSKERYNKLKENIVPNYFIIIANVLIYIALVYVFGIKKDILGNIELLKCLIITPFLLSIIKIDCNCQIIPNRINLTLFEIGLVVLFIQGIFNINLATNMLLGMLIGAGAFMLITVIGGIAAKKDAMGWGDVKLMGALGLLFGFTDIVLIMILSFFIGAIISIVLLILRKAKEYVPFGPFIVIASFIVMLISNQEIINLLMKIFTIGA